MSLLTYFSILSDCNLYSLLCIIFLAIDTDEYVVCVYIVDYYAGFHVHAYVIQLLSCVRSFVVLGQQI